MKAMIFILFCFGLFNSGCSNDIQKIELPLLYGKWIWVESSGGIDGRTITPGENEPSKYLRFVKPDLMESYLDDSLVSSKNFTLEKGLSIYSADSLYFIVEDAGSMPLVIYQVTNERLSLADNVYDGFGHEYIRVKE